MSVTFGAIVLASPRNYSGFTRIKINPDNHGFLQGDFHAMTIILHPLQLIYKNSPLRLIEIIIEAVYLDHFQPNKENKHEIYIKYSRGRILHRGEYFSILIPLLPKTNNCQYIFKNKSIYNTKLKDKDT